MFKRQAAALSAHEELVQEFRIQGSQQTFYSGRPDFVVFRWEADSEDTTPELKFMATFVADRLVLSR